WLVSGWHATADASRLSRGLWRAAEDRATALLNREWDLLATRKANLSHVFATGPRSFWNHAVWLTPRLSRRGPFHAGPTASRRPPRPTQTRRERMRPA